MYPGTIYNWYDESGISRNVDPAVIDNSPLFMVVGSFDKGPENLMEVAGKDFNSLFGKMSFEKHGQNAIQAQRIVDAGGRLLIKRVCADDATLANVVLVAKVTGIKSTEPVRNEDGDELYIITDRNSPNYGTIGTHSELENTDGVIEEEYELYYGPETLSIKWEAVNISGCKTFEEVKEKALELLDEANRVYPLMVFTDNGRGVSSKAIRLIPDYNTSKGIGKTFYTATVFEGTTNTEAVAVTIDPNALYANEAYGLERSMMTQVQGEVISVVYESYVTDLAIMLGLTEDEVKNQDIIFGYNYKGNELDGFEIDAESVDLNSDYGIELKAGSNGAFGDKPVNTEAWTQAICKVYNGEDTDEVWDVDQHKVAAICDANFPMEIKKSIAKFVNFRKDCVFFRDYGLNVNTFLDVKSIYDKFEEKSRFIADYATSYTVKDPLTKKNIKVTMMYDFVECLVNHISSAAYNPLAGTVNGFVLKEAIKGTINYTPIITPTVNQKQAMDDIRVNYAVFEGDNCVVQTLYTSQDKNSQLSYINNVLAIQEVARAVRTACPKNRFSTTEGYDMSGYAKSVSNVLTGFAGHFSTLQFTYTKDKLKASQKIFYATIVFAFNDWVQTEVFDLYAIDNN